MKRITAIKLCVCLLLLGIMLFFSGCNNDKFESLDMMIDYLHGIWYCSSENEYIIVKDYEHIYKFRTTYINRFLNDYFESVVATDVDEFKSLTVSECLSAVSSDIFSNPINNSEKYVIYYNQGKIVFDEGTDSECSLVVTDNILQYIDSDNEILKEYTKISEDIVLTESIFGSYVSEALDDYEISNDIFLPTMQEYVNRLKSLHPEINSWTLVDKNMYTDNGSYKNYNSVLLYKDDTLTLSLNKETTIINNTNEIIIHRRNYASLSELLKYVEIKILDCPSALSTSEIIDKFSSDGKVGRGTRSWRTTIDGIEYYILRNVDGKTTYIAVTIK